MSSMFQRHHSHVQGMDISFILETSGITDENADLYNHFVDKYHELNRQWADMLDEHAVITEICRWAQTMMGTESTNQYYRFWKCGSCGANVDYTQKTCPNCRFKPYVRFLKKMACIPQ